ncbi:hypothetical protein L9G16_13505 [Shewanella sp. A25]|nr:hypothetical protein [Shewanella shenzhenensis]
MKNGFVALALVVFLAACSNSPDKNGNITEQTARTDGYRCEKVVETGTRLSSRRCTTSQQREDEQRSAELRKKIELKK